MEVKFKEWTCTVCWAQYMNGRTAIHLRDAGDGQMIACATVNVSAVLPPAADEVDIKDWSENEGMKEALMAFGVIDRVVRLIPTGFVKAHRCRLSTAALMEAEKALGTLRSRT